MRKMNPALLTLSLALGCGTSVSPDPGLPGGDTNDPSGPGQDNPLPTPEAQACQKMDIVFVVDDSGSMAEEQSNLGANFPQFLSVIEEFLNDDGLPLDYRIAVTTSGRDVDYTMKIAPPFPGLPEQTFPMSEQGDNGAFRTGCGLPGDRRWIERGDTNIQSMFSCLANVGTSGPSLEMPLYALQLGLSERVQDGTNSQFLRDDALLAVVVLSDEDDCSRTDNGFTIEGDGCGVDDPDYLGINQSASFLNSVTGGAGRWATAVIAAGQSNCESSFGSAYASPRLMNFVNAAGANGVFSSICEGDLTSALEDALHTFTAACNQLPPVD